MGVPVGMRTLVVSAAVALAGTAVAAEGPNASWIAAVLADTAGVARTDSALVLTDSVVIRVRADGRVQTEGWRVVRLDADVMPLAAALHVPYVEGQGEPPTLEGWIVRTDPGSLPRRLVVGDRSFAENALRTEGHVRWVGPDARTRAGDLMFATWKHDDAPPFVDFDQRVQLALPARRVSVRLEWPPDWELSVWRLPGDSAATRMSTGSASWTFTDVPALESRHVRRLAFSFRPPGKAAVRRFGEWVDVARWIAELAGAAATPPALPPRAGDGEAAGLDSLARRVQALRYVSVELGLGRGGGYRPRPASRVLAEGYGDCKDKANVFRELALAAGLRAWLVLVYSSDREYVRPEWATPQQFNHCIAAVAVSETLHAAATTDLPGVGRVLFFDPTDPDTPFGELPELEQGGFALFADSALGRLVRLPEAPPEANAEHWYVSGELLPEGGSEGHATLELHAAAAVFDRALWREAGAARWLAFATNRVGARSPGWEWTLSADEPTRNAGFAAFGRWRASDLGRVMADGTLLVAPPPLAAPLPAPAPRGATTGKLEHVARAARVSYRLRVPANWSITVAPRDTVLASAAASFSRRTRMLGDTLAVDLEWRVSRLASQDVGAPAALEFERRVRAAERSAWRVGTRH